MRRVPGYQPLDAETHARRHARVDPLVAQPGDQLPYSGAHDALRQPVRERLGAAAVSLREPGQFVGSKPMHAPRAARRQGLLPHE
ncbi:hypothetical protein D3C72_1827860 [compost metagenome]